MGKWGISRYAIDGSCSVNFMTEFSALEGQLDFGGEWGRGSRWKGLRIGRHSQLFDILFQIVGKFGHLCQVESGEWIFFDFTLDGVKGVASVTNARWGRGEI